VTHLRKMMLEELQRRNFAKTTVQYYLQAVEEFAAYFHKPPDQLNQDHLLQYQAHLLSERKLQPRTARLHVCALRFFFNKTLKRRLPADDIPYPRAPRRLPEILTVEEVARLAISNHRLIQLADGQVTFRWKDYAHGSKKRKMTITAHEFLRRFLMHVLPKGFVRIRFFGFLANRRRRTDLAQCQQLLAAPAEPPPRPSSGEPISAWLCPLCGGTMVVIERLTAQQVADRTAGRPGYVDTS